MDSTSVDVDAPALRTIAAPRRRRNDDEEYSGWPDPQGNAQCSIRERAAGSYEWSRQTEDMLRWNNYDETELFTLELSDDERTNPYRVIHRFYQSQDLATAKEKLSFWCHTALTDPWHYTAMDRIDLATFHKQVHVLMEAVFVINEVKLIQAASQESWEVHESHVVGDAVGC